MTVMDVVMIALTSFLLGFKFCAFLTKHAARAKGRESE